jgi:hypothetical protein
MICGVQADEISLTPSADVAFLYETKPSRTENFLNGGRAPIGAALHSGDLGRGFCSLLRFEVSGIPAQAKIRRVRLILNPIFTYPSDLYPANEALCVYQMNAENSNWVEGEGTSLRDPEHERISVPGANACYLNMESFDNETTHSGVAWLSGHLFGNLDFNGEKVGSFALPESGLTAKQVIEINIAPETIQAWLQNPDLAKAGLVLRMVCDTATMRESRFAIFDSREGASPPELIVEYTVK